MTIPLTPCQSSNIKAYGYDQFTLTLAVQFGTTGAVWHYTGVPIAVFEGMKTAPSIGSYFSKNIRSKYQGKLAPAN